MTDLAPLIARIEGLAGPVDGVTAGGILNGTTEDVKAGRWVWEPSSEEWLLAVQALMGSADAALALAAEVLPGAYGKVSFGGGEEIAMLQSRPTTWYIGLAPTPALALLLALLRALQAKGGGDGDNI